MKAMEETDEKSIKDNNKKTIIILSIFWVLLLSLGIFVAMELVYSDFKFSGTWDFLFMDIKWTGSIVFLVCLLGLGIYTVLWWKKNIVPESIKERPIDWLGLEILILGMALTIFLCGACLPRLHYSQTTFMWRNEYVSLMCYLLAIVMIAALFYGEVLLLLRKVLTGMVKRTSIIMEMHRKYKEHTSVERQIEDRYKWLNIGSIILAGGIFFLNLLSVLDNRMNFIQFLTFIFCIFLVGIEIWYLIKDSFPKEVVRLMHNIHALRQEIDSADVLPLNANSLLYEANGEIEDIKKQMQENIESRMRSERMKVDLITNVSHDLKTPLTSMIGYTELLKKEELNPAARDYVEILSDKQEKLTEMIQNIFELSKATSHSEQLDMQVLDMNKLVEQIMGDMVDVISNCGFSYVKQLSEEPLLFYGDNNKMYRVVQNLIENTVKYTMPNTRVFIKTQAEGGKVRLTVKNIAAYEMDFDEQEIMERFTRGDKSRTTQGHGLGLAIASSLLENMGGMMKIVVDGDVFQVVAEVGQAAAPAD